MTATLDPRKAHAAHMIGDIVCILSWINDERAMILMPARRKGAPWFCLLESAAYKYDDPRYLARQAVKAAEVLGMDETTSTWIRVADIIMNYLPDLIRMPSAPPPEKIAGSTFGELKLKADGQLLHSEDMVLDESDRSLTYAAA